MNKRFFLIVSLLFSTFLSSSLRAQEAVELLSPSSSSSSFVKTETTSAPIAPSAPMKSVEGGLISQNLESVSISLAIVLLVIFILAWLVRKAAPSGFGGTKGQMKVLSVLPLGGKERIMLVDVAGTQMVLGISTAGVNCLHVFADPVVSIGSVSSQQQGFQAVLQGFIANKATNKDSG